MPIPPRKTGSPNLYNKAAKRSSENKYRKFHQGADANEAEVVFQTTFFEFIVD